MNITVPNEAIGLAMQIDAIAKKGNKITAMEAMEFGKISGTFAAIIAIEIMKELRGNG